MRRWSPRTLGLRSRVAVAFGVSALALSLLLAVSTYTISSSFLLRQRGDTALRQAVFNARAVNGALSTSSPALPDLLARLDASAGESSSPLVLHDDAWFDAQFDLGHDRLPASFLAAAATGEPVTQRFELDDELAMAVALPLEETGGTFIEVFSLQESDQTLRTLANILTGTATLTTLLGVLLGVWVSRRSLRPLRAVTAAASAFAAGDLQARLDGNEDPDLRELARAFNDTASELEARVARDTRFAANVSHELRTPLTTMLNAVEVIHARGSRFDEESQEVIDLLRQGVHRFAQMVEDLLDISRVDTGLDETALRPLHAAGFVRRVADRAAGHAVTWVQPPADRATVRADPRRLERVIENLVLNAEHHAGGVDRVGVELVQDRLRVIVDDRGPGVPPGLERQVFERFARASGIGDRSDAGGVGLGLALVAEHVRMHKGQVWVEAREGGGARFVVELPVAAQ